MSSLDSGLTEEEATARRAQDGPNQLPTASPPKFLRIFMRQFIHPLIYILILVGVLSLLLGHTSDAFIILIVLLFNASIGALQEYGAEKSAINLRAIVPARSRVLRDSVELEIDSSQLVRGDIVFLESGSKVPADLRLLHTHGVEIDESLLTGESLPVTKNALAGLPSTAALGDRQTMAFAGTLVTRGRARGVVTSIGLETELGKIADAVLRSVSTQTPLVIRMDKFVTKLALLFAAAVVVIGAILIARDEPLFEVLQLAVALGVAAIPEGLPVALTITLAVASRRMAKRHVIVRHLSAVEALGSCTFIATDKTGTLTINEITAKLIALPLQPAIATTDADLKARNICRAAALCNEAKLIQKDDDVWVGQGDAMDVALLIMAQEASIDLQQLQATWQLRAQLPFESERQYAATLHQAANEQLVSVKGAIERVLPMCNSYATSEGVYPIDAHAIEQQAMTLANNGYRVLAIAGATPIPQLDHLEPQQLCNLTFLGLIGMIDPLRPKTREAISAARSAGMRVAMITGDHPATALNIARELDLAQEFSEIVTGPMLKSAQTAAEVATLTNHARIFARVEPQQKLQIVQSLIHQGHFVAVTGDGANDAPALKAAHVGVAMGKSGTDAARESADLIITDDRFSSLIAGIEEGRIAYANIRKVIYLLISTGIGEIALIFLSILLGLPLPLTAVQLLWLNLVTEGVQTVALAFEGKEGDELTQPPRTPNETIFNRLMIERVALSASVMGGVGILVYISLIRAGLAQTAIHNHILLLMVLFENILIGNARSETKSAFLQNPLRNPFLLLGTVTALLIHLAAMHIPLLQRVLGVSPISPGEWLYYVLLASTMFLVIEAHKLFRRRRTLRHVHQIA